MALLIANLTSSTSMSLVPATRHLARRIEPLALSVAKRWISVQQLDDQQAGGSGAVSSMLYGYGRSTGPYAPITQYTQLSCFYMWERPSLSERNERDARRSVERGSHNCFTTVWILRLNLTDNIIPYRSDASCRAWFRMGRILAPSKPSRSTISACCHLSKALLCLYASPCLYECRNTRAPNCPGEHSKSQRCRILRGQREFNR
jgi:hypothetical protein